MDKRIILRLREKGLSYKEISEKLDLSINTEKSYLRRNKNRKYCSHACYINHRFGEKDE